LNDWRRALVPGGYVVIVTPNLDHHIKQWRKARWNNEEWNNKWSKARHGAAGFYGWQRECEPTITSDDTLSSRYWDCHKSGYNKQSLAFWLLRAGFDSVSVQVCKKVHLVAYGRKHA
jgi:hypothetical protein